MDGTEERRDKEAGELTAGELAEEFLERHRRGERPAISQYLERYPDLAHEIRELFPAVLMMEHIGSDGEPGSGTEQGLREAPKQVGEYRILRAIGRGGMGVVYEAEQASLERRVALKVLPFHALLSESQLERFRREAQTAARLHHTNIVPVFGVGEDDGVHFYAMQFINGESLDKVVEEVRALRSEGASSARTTESMAGRLLSGEFEKQPLGQSPEFEEASAIGKREGESDEKTHEERPASESSSASLLGADSAENHSGSFGERYFRTVACLGARVADALCYAHSEGILHRDIKPSNILLDARGTVWVTDFGLAKAEGTGTLTHTGDVVGTLAYMAPERFEGWSDPRSDVYGLGLTLYELLTLRRAFDESDRRRLMKKVAEEEPPRPRKLEPHIPRDLETIVLKAMEKEPSHRYATAAQMGADLERYVEGKPIRARRSGTVERAWLWCRRKPAVATLTASVLILLLVSALGASLFALKVRAERNSAQRALFGSYRAEARARRWSGRAGQRFASLEAIAKATEILRSLGGDGDEILQLRSQAIACMALADLQEERRWNPGGVGPPALAFDARLERYACGEGNGTGNISVRSVADGAEAIFLPGFGDRPAHLHLSRDGRFLAVKYYKGSRIHFCVWDLEQVKAVVQVKDGVHRVAMDIRRDNRVAAAGRRDGSVHFYDLPSGRELKSLPPVPPVARPHTIRFDHDGRRLAISSEGGRDVRIRQLETGHLLGRLPHPKRVFGIAWSPDGELLAAACQDYRVYVWEVDNAEEPLAIGAGHQAEVTTVAFNHSGDILASRGWDGVTRLWEPRSGDALVSVPGYQAGFSSDDQRLAFSGNSELGIWKVAAGRECRTFHGHRGFGKSPASVDVSPDGGLLASAGGAGVRVWDLAAGTQLALLPGGAHMALFEPAGEALITSGEGGVLRWPIGRDDARPGWLRLGPPESLWAVATTKKMSLSRDGRTLAVVHPLGVHVLDFRTPTPTRIPLENTAGAAFTSVSPDGELVAMGVWQGYGVKVCDTRSGQVVRELLPEAYSAVVAFSPDGKWLVAGTWERYRFFATRSWKPGHEIPRDAAASGNDPFMAFTPDGRLMAIAYSKRVVRLVAPDTGEEYATLEPPNPQPVSWLCFSPDCTWLAVASGPQHVIHVWDLWRIRKQLRTMGLDWDEPPEASPALAPVRRPSEAIRVEVLSGERD